MVLEVPLAPATASDGPGEGLDDDLTNLNWLQQCDLLCDLIPTSGDHVSPTDTASGGKGHGAPRTLSVVPPVAYDPQVHVHTKPPYSFASLIFMAIESAPDKLLPVKDIYGWIMDKFPYYRTAASGWKNSVRHNLSLSKCFRKLDRPPRGVSGSRSAVAGAKVSSLHGKWCVSDTLQAGRLGVRVLWSVERG